MSGQFIAAATGTAGAASPAGSATDAPLTALVAADGLFLRAEHLTTIQAYGRGFATAVARAGGAGIAYGCTASVQGDRLEVSAGLAIAPDGQPLLIRTPVSRQLPPTSAGKYLVAELRHLARRTGTPEQVFGLLCDDPCGSGQAFRPYETDEVQIDFRVPALSPKFKTEAQFRSAVATAYFADEANQAEPSLTPDLGSANWSTGTGPVDGQGVPVGLLIQIGSAWALDVWAARRDRLEAPPERGWARRTGRRPMDVFLAQVLQFQAQQADVGIPADVRSGVGSAPTLPQYFVELPPAGYLPIDPSSGMSVNDQVTRLFGADVDLRFCSARPDEIGLALERARHLDRIPLSGATSGGPEKVDVIVPDGRPTTRSAASSVRIGSGSVTVVHVGNEHPYEALARLGQAPGGEVTLALAGASPADSNRADGFWVDLRLGRSPFELDVEKSATVRVTVAAHQPRQRTSRRQGQALQRFHLFGSLTCTAVSRDAGTGLPTFEGQLRGQVVGQAMSTPIDLFVNTSMRLSVQDTSAGYVLKLELAQPLPLSLALEIAVRSGGQWDVSFDSGLSERVTSGVKADLTEIPEREVPLSPYRWAAERGLVTLSGTNFPQDAVTQLFAGAGPPTTGTAYATAYDWVFFTRRHLLDCGQPSVDEIPTIRLDLYVEDAVTNGGGANGGGTNGGGANGGGANGGGANGGGSPPAAAATPAATSTPAAPGVAPATAAPSTVAPVDPAKNILYVTQVSWSPLTGLLSTDSVQVLEAWRDAHPDAIATEEGIWPGGTMSQKEAEALVGQVVPRMIPGAGVSVQIHSGSSQLPTTAGSTGVLVVGTTASIPGKPGLAARAGRRR